MRVNPQRSVDLSDPTARRVVVVLDPYTFEKMTYDTGLRDKLNQPGVLALPDDVDPMSHPVLEQLNHQGLWQRDAVLVQNPYNRDQYEVGDEPHSEFAQSRLRIMTEVLYLLGAREFHYVELEKHGAEARGEGRGGGGKGPAKAEASWSRDTAESLRRGAELHHTWTGGAPDPGAARALLARSNLSHDGALNTLIALRVGSSNQHKTWIETFDLLRESSSVITLAAKVRAGLYNGEATSKRMQKQRSEYSVRYEIKY